MLARLFEDSRGGWAVSDIRMGLDALGGEAADDVRKVALSCCRLGIEAALRDVQADFGRVRRPGFGMHLGAGGGGADEVNAGLEFLRQRDDVGKDPFSFFGTVEGHKNAFVHSGTRTQRSGCSYP